MNVSLPPGWNLDSGAEHALTCSHINLALELTVSPVYKSKRTSGRDHDEVPIGYRVRLDQDWFSEGLLGDVKRAAKVETREEALSLATEYMAEFATGSGAEQSADETSSDRTPVSTGSAGLDAMLGGGLPQGRSVLVTGTPGAGKSTLAMQFLQEGLDDADRCLFVSTEQTRDELVDSFETFEFDLDHENLALTTIHAVDGAGDGGLRIGSLDGDDEGSPAFTREGLLDFFRRGVTADRIVLDSVSGLRPISESDAEYRRAVLDVIRLFNDELRSTALLTAEHFGGVGGDVEAVERENAVQYTTHGVIRLWREQVGGEFRRFISVTKMRGVDHDVRAFEAGIDEAGLRIVTGLRSFNVAHSGQSQLPTGIEGLDEKLGGGFPRGSGVLLEHDERSSTVPLLLGIGTEALDAMVSIVLVPGSNTKPQQVAALFDEMGTEMDLLLERDQLFVVDPYRVWTNRFEDSPNVFVVPEALDGVKDIFEEIDGRARGRGTLYLMNVPALVHRLGTDAAHELRYWQEATVVGDDDVLLDFVNPDLLSDEAAAFYADNANQILRQWTDDTGLQYLKVRKGLAAEQGSVALIEYLADPPYLRLH